MPVKQVEQCVNMKKAPADIRVGETVPFVVSLCENTERPEVYLYYRPVGASRGWQRRKMMNLAGQYRFAVSIDNLYQEGVEYYVVTEGATWGSKSKPKFIPTFH